MLRPRANYANNINYNCNAHRVITSGSVDPKVKKKKKRLFFCIRTTDGRFVF